jgi:hypothetical protein
MLPYIRPPKTTPNKILLIKNCCKCHLYPQGPQHSVNYVLSLQQVVYFSNSVQPAIDKKNNAIFSIKFFEVLLNDNYQLIVKLITPTEMNNQS